ncbi:hypothetical protein AUR64_11595 [Haloprofundus marisrubri]|uniref:Glycerophosphoryl diester phosphodiesterase membrane domain-containing protein n=1 Tax=Haloprofundus marisrubri TaxID=1514971 RepID=A0A0W1R9T7_9EURY|nr:hypothetical protein [Haloprofundus marisrubri]KTG10221.1 hypothetical protein AUR64_11595 [Haloprofundus marisrubri]
MSDRTALLGSEFGEEERELSVWSTLWTAVSRIRRDPGLVVPFFFAGVVVTIVDYLRLRDSVPVSVVDRMGGGGIDITYLIYPTGSRTTTTPFGALVDLTVAPLLTTVGLELTAFLAVGVAGWLTLSRALGNRTKSARLFPYLGLLALLHVAFRLLGLVGTIGGPVGLLLFVGTLAVFVRVFLVPVLVVAGDDISAAFGRSARLTRGYRWTVFGLVLVVGLGTFALGSVSLVGPLLSATLVAPVHAVALVVVAERIEKAEGTERAERTNQPERTDRRAGFRSDT